ncbi:MAG: anti-sigma factor domain-containing protein [Firmicutes bacterium]|nr:anti-sigma factor domain-containing protein [Bacillota bacterium]
MKNRGLLMEVRGKRGIVLTPDGRFEEITLTSPACIGDESVFPAREGREAGGVLRVATSWAGRRRFSSVAIAAALILGIMASIVVEAVRADRIAVAYVDVDINPAVELGINRFNRVVSVEGIDDEGREMLSGIDLTRMDLETAVQEIATAAEAHGYVRPGDEQTVLITVTPARGPEVKPEIARRVEKASQAVSKHLESKQVKGTVEVIQAAPEVREKARQINVSPGRLAVLLKAQENGIDIGPDLFTKKPSAGDSRKGQQAQPPGERQDAEGTTPEQQPGGGHSPGGEQQAPGKHQPGQSPASPQPGGRQPDHQVPAEQPQVGHPDGERPPEPPSQGPGKGHEAGSKPQPVKPEPVKPGAPQPAQPEQGAKSQSRLLELIKGAKQEKDWGRLLEEFGEEVRKQIKEAAEKRDERRPGDNDGRKPSKPEGKEDGKQDKKEPESKPASKRDIRPDPGRTGRVRESAVTREELLRGIKDWKEAREPEIQQLLEELMEEEKPGN